jgi:hypothetical protein
VWRSSPVHAPLWCTAPQGVAQPILENLYTATTWSQHSIIKKKSKHTAWPSQNPLSSSKCWNWCPKLQLHLFVFFLSKLYNIKHLTYIYIIALRLSESQNQANPKLLQASLNFHRSNFNFSKLTWIFEQHFSLHQYFN